MKILNKQETIKLDKCCGAYKSIRLKNGHELEVSHRLVLRHGVITAYQKYFKGALVKVARVCRFPAARERTANAVNF